MSRVLRFGQALIIAALVAAAYCAEKPKETTAKPPANAAEDRERWQKECPDCARVLVSRLDPANGGLHFNERTLPQADFLEHDAKLMAAGKVKPKLWFTPYRENAEYNIVWVATMDPTTVPATMHVWATVYDVASDRKLFQVWHKSMYWETDHPDRRCLADAVKFLRTRRVTPAGIVFTYPQDDSYAADFPSPKR